MVLVAEDQAITALELRTLLKRIGYKRVLCFSDGVDAIKCLMNEDPDFAILDIKLADGVSGLDIARNLKEKKIPFIFVSAFSDPTYFEHAKALDPVGIITKPFDESELVNVLDNLRKN